MEKLNFDSLCKKGGRKQNQDYYKILPQPPLFQFIVADGLGGQGGGQVASIKATQKMLLDYSKNMSDPVTQAEYFSPEWLVQKFELSHHHIRQEQVRREELAHMATTMVVLMVMDGKAIWGHVGDSRIYLFRKSKIYHQTKDHSVPQMLVSSGEIESDEMRHHPDRNRLLRALGDKREDIQARVHGEEILQSGDVFLLCTDGFWEYVVEAEMFESLYIASNPKDWLTKMEQHYLLPRVEEERIKQGLQKSENDNYTALAVWYGEAPSQKRSDDKDQKKLSLYTRFSKQVNEVWEDFKKYKS